MSNLSVSIGGGQPIPNAQVNLVRQQADPSQAEKTLATKKDGLDTIGFMAAKGIDYIITGKGLNAKPGDTVFIEGKAVGVVDFVEQEDNSFSEGFDTGMKTNLGGLEKSVAGAPFSLAAGLFKGAQAAVNSNLSRDNQVVDSVSKGPALKAGEFKPEVEAQGRGQQAIIDAEDDLIKEASARRIMDGG